jgi:hypothetical protein
LSERESASNGGDLDIQSDSAGAGVTATMPLPNTQEPTNIGNECLRQDIIERAKRSDLNGEGLDRSRRACHNLAPTLLKKWETESS